VVHALKALHVQKTASLEGWWRTPSFHVQYYDLDANFGPKFGLTISTCRQWENFCVKAAEVSNIVVSFNQEDLVYAEGY
jgi:hypothetical protein